MQLHVSEKKKMDDRLTPLGIYEIYNPPESFLMFSTGTQSKTYPSKLPDTIGCVIKIYCFFDLEIVICCRIIFIFTPELLLSLVP